MFLEIHVIYLKIILGKQLIYKLRTGYLTRKLIADWIQKAVNITSTLPK